MSLPKRTTILIVGAGPSGLSAAISLVKSGVPTSDVVVVDAVNAGANSSRALTIHASTLEMLDSVGCADILVKEGIQAQSFSVNDRAQPESPLICADFSSLAPYTRFPFVLIIPQNVTERILLEYAQSLGITVLRPFKVIGMKTGGHQDGTVDVSFESGEVLRACYVLGADGHKSIVRTTAGIAYADPDGESVETTGAQMVFADVVFDSEIQIPSNRMNAFGSASAFFGLIPLVTSWFHPDADRSKITSGSTVYRIGCQVPKSEGAPPSQPPTEYLQDIVDKYGPVFLSSDPTVNPKPVKISETVWSTRYRTHAAIASTFFTRFDSSSKNGGIILLIGDSAHIHNPAGGMGMNLGIRDAIGLGPVVVQHMARSKEVQSSHWASRGIDRCLKEYTDTRYKRAISTIHLSKRLLGTMNRVKGRGFSSFRNAIIRFIGQFWFVKRAIAWRVSGMAFK